MKKLYHAMVVFLTCEFGFMLGTQLKEKTMMKILLCIGIALLITIILIIREELKMMRTKYLTLIDKFVNRYNKDHTATKIQFKEENKNAYIINQFGDIMAKAPNKQDLAIMLCVCEDTRTKKNEDYWMNSKDKWEYSPTFLNEILTRYRRGK